MRFHRGKRLGRRRSRGALGNFVRGGGIPALPDQRGSQPHQSDTAQGQSQTAQQRSHQGIPLDQKYCQNADAQNRQHRCHYEGQGDEEEQQVPGKAYQGLYEAAQSSEPQGGSGADAAEPGDGGGGLFGVCCVCGGPGSRGTAQAAEALAGARRRVADCLGCSFKEITFTSGGSEADNQAIVSAARIGERKGKKHIISTAFEHHAVLHTLKKLEKEGFEVTLLDVGPTGTITPQQVAEAIREDTCLVTIMYANNEIGSILPIPEIGKVCHEKGVLFHTDAVQAAGHLHINVKEQNIDMLSLSGHKFHGPKGVGVLYARQGILLTNIIEGGAQERGKRAGTENIPGIMGLAAALEESCGHIDEDTARLSKLRDKLIAGLSKIPTAR